MCSSSSEKNSNQRKFYIIEEGKGRVEMVTARRKKINAKRNYKKEAEYENRPEQVKRRMARNRARAAAIKAGKVKKGDGKEVDHVGRKRTGDLSKRKTRVVSRAVNRRKQPKTKARGKARNTK